jgi:hypothetical protein
MQTSFEFEMMLFYPPNGSELSFIGDRRTMALGTRRGLPKQIEQERTETQD